MTKINILHVAINYIRALENILHTGDAGFNSYGTAIVQSPFMPTPQTEAKEEQEMHVEVAQKSPPPPPPQQQQQRVKVLRPLNNVNLKPAHAPRNGRGLKVLHPQTQQKAVTATVQQQERRPGIMLQQPPAVTGGGLSAVPPADLTPSKSFEDEAFSGSEDSGIGDNEEGGCGGGGGMEDCPDWTELTSTLEFPKRGSLDTMLTTTAAATVTISSSATASQVLVARQVSFPELDSDPGADLFGDILCGDEDGGGGRMDHDGGGCYVGKSLFDISDNFPLIM